jgi:aspartate/methionine/tyrosine aminotransferase
MQSEIFRYRFTNNVLKLELFTALRPKDKQRLSNKIVLAPVRSSMISDTNLSAGNVNRLSNLVQAMVDESASSEKTGAYHGTFVILDAANKLSTAGKDVIFCCESIMSTVPPTQIIKKSKDQLHSAATREVAPFNGIVELRKAIAKRFERLYSQKIDWRDQIVVTSGSLEGEYHTMGALLNPGDEVIMTAPGFFFDIPAKLLGAKPVFYHINPKNNYYHDASEIEKLITKKTRMIVVCNPHNPTGRVLTKAELLGISELAKKYNLYILYDQVYERVVYDNREFIPMVKFKDIQDRLITATSFSKVYNMINYRLGYVIAPPDIIKGIGIAHAACTGGISSITQQGGIAALDPGLEDKHLSKVLSILQRGRDYAVMRFNEVPGFSMIPPEGTNLMFPKISEFGMTSMDFARYLLKEAKVACAPGTAYHGEGHVRISLRTERNEEVVDRVVRAVSKLPHKKRE